MERSRFLVETSWLAEHLHEQHLRVVDMRGYVRTAESDGVQEASYVGAREEYEKAHIPGAVYIDWTSDIVDPDDDLLVVAGHQGECRPVVLAEAHPAELRPQIGADRGGPAIDVIFFTGRKFFVAGIHILRIGRIVRRCDADDRRRGRHDLLAARQACRRQFRLRDVIGQAREHFAHARRLRNFKTFFERSEKDVSYS